MKQNMTIVVGIDAKTIEQFRLTYPTWQLHRAEMWAMPWVIFYDRDQLEYGPLRSWLTDTVGLTNPEIVPWPPPAHAVPYESQRARMLAGHFYVPAEHVATEFFLKIDTDAVAAKQADWLKPLELIGDAVCACCRWGYTKGVGALSALEKWGDAMPQMAAHPRLDIPQEPDQLRVGHARFCSWCAIYRMDFARLVAELAAEHCGAYQMPYPSEDSCRWYAAARMRMPMMIHNMKQYHWSNHSRIDELRRAVAEALCQN